MSRSWLRETNLEFDMSGRDCETQFSYEFQSPSGRKCSVSIAVGKEQVFNW